MDHELDALTTEQARDDVADLDLLPAEELVRLLLAQDATVPAVVAAAADEITAAVDLVAERMERGGRLIYLGAGTPGRLGFGDAVECVPTFGLAADQVSAVIAGGTAALTGAYEGDEDDAEAGARDLLAKGIGSLDTVVAISASGRTPYVLAGVAQARASGAATVGVVCVAASPLASAVDIAIEVVTGPEVIAGSTRLKAASAQKLVLHTLSTSVMIRLGRVFGTFMVDVCADNDKLRRRQRRIVAQATGASEAAVEAALTAAGGRGRVAVVALLTGGDPERARHLLAAGGGRIRTALALSEGTNGGAH